MMLTGHSYCQAADIIDFYCNDADKADSYGIFVDIEVMQL